MSIIISSRLQDIASNQLTNVCYTANRIRGSTGLTSIPIFFYYLLRGDPQDH
jgi:hypothetical protein